MPTANFRTPLNFPLYARSDDEFYSRYCDKCGEAHELDCDICPTCGGTLSAPYYDEVEAMSFYDDVQMKLDELNEALAFHEIVLRGGYYAGVQLDVKLSKDADAAGFDEVRGAEYVDNESTRYYFDMPRSRAVRKYEAEQRKVSRLLAKIAREYGFDCLVATATFSNGETSYSIA